MAPDGSLSSMWWIMKPRVLVAVAVLLFAAYLVVAFNWSYSDGNRAGYIQK